MLSLVELNYFVLSEETLHGLEPEHTYVMEELIISSRTVNLGNNEV